VAGLYLDDSYRVAASIRIRGLDLRD